METRENSILKKVFYFMFMLFSFLQVGFLNALPEDEINFFNVGQGHAVLINKVGAIAPLLIDAGSTAHPSKRGMRYDWSDQDQELLGSQISERILKMWKASNGGTLRGKEFFLNVIVTHPDKDHKDLVPSILTALQEKASFIPTFLLGGKLAQYAVSSKKTKKCEKKPTFSEVLKKYEKQIFFSEKWPEMCISGKLDFLEESGCITHLFCPRGPGGNSAEDRNKWSIITRIQINGMTALLPGDTDNSVKNRMLDVLGNQKNELETDILLAPHHGAEGTYNAEWDNLVNPRAIIIGAALMHSHPRGKTLLDFLTLKEGRIWNDRIMPHGLQYYCENTIQEKIEKAFSQREDMLFDKVPNSPIEILINQPPKQWRLAWVDLPIYTLWTTGSLRFKKELLKPEFIDAPHGLMGYIAVSDPKYLLSPYIRGKLTPLISSENKLQEEISKLVEIQHGKIKGAEYNNMILKEALLIEDHKDRSHYYNTLIRSFSEIRPLLYRNTLSFTTLRKAIVERNRKVDRNEERVQEAANFMFRNFKLLKQQNDLDLSIALCSGAFDQNILIFKVFLKSTHHTKQLKNYVKLASNIGQFGPSVDELEDLCPFGYPEWVQLGKMVEFFKNEVMGLTQESVNIEDIVDLTSLRRQGNNFKQITQSIIEDEVFLERVKSLLFQVVMNGNTNIIDISKESLQKKLEEYFPSFLDEFLS